MQFSSKQAKKIVHDGFKNYNAALAAHHAAAKAGDQLLARHLSWAPLLTGNAFIAPLVAANVKLHPRNRVLPDQLVAVAFNEAGKIGQTALSEAVRLHPIPKKNGKSRITMNFGLRHKAVQIVLHDLLSHHFKPKAWQFGYGKQKGVHAAVKSVRTHLESGYTHFARLDIKDFFPSFEVRSLTKGLPLPVELVENALVGKNLRIKQAKKSLNTSSTHKGVEANDWKFAKMPWVSAYSPSPLHLQISEARRGVPMGSISSPLVGSHTISQLAIPNGLKVVNYADDFALLAKSEVELAEYREALIESVGALPGGKFKLRPKQSGEALTFLGHVFHVGEDGVTVCPSEDAKGVLVTKYELLTTGLLNFTKADEKLKQEATWALGRTKSYLDGWSAAFSECDNVHGYVKPFYDEFIRWAKCWELDPEAIELEAVACEVDLDLDYDFSVKL